VRGARAALVLFCASAFLPGCATRGSINRTRADIATLGRQLEELRAAQERLTLEVGRMATDLRLSLAQLTGLRPDVAQSTVAVERLRARLDATEATVARLQSAVERVEPEPPRAATPPQTPTSPPTPAPASLPAPDSDRTPPGEPAPHVDPVARAYTAALDQYQKREYGQAVLDFLDFIAKYPKHPLANNAQYWIGEAYYVQRDYRQATLEFRRVLDSDPRGTKVPDALLKEGLCSLNLHQPGRAYELWRRILREYPDSEAARKAGSFLSARGVSSPR